MNAHSDTLESLGHYGSRIVQSIIPGIIDESLIYNIPWITNDTCPVASNLLNIGLINKPLTTTSAETLLIKTTFSPLQISRISYSKFI